MTIIRKAAVLGAGAMGSGIAAHLANAGIPTLLLDMVPREPTEDERKQGLDLSHPRVRNRLATAGIAGAQKAGAFGHPGRVGRVTPGNFEDDLGQLAGVDWIVEVVVENLDIKVALLGKVAVHVSPTAILTTNTSGLSVNAMAKALPESLQRRFFGTHFFNPPRYMYLLELVPTQGTDAAVLDGFQEFAETRLGKGVVRGKDTPNFIANRIGVFGTAYTLHALTRHGVTIETADAATGKALGRAGTATFGTSDLAGVDVLAHVVRTQHDGAPDDESRDVLILPAWVETMIERGYHGRKAGGGFYRNKRTEVIDPETVDYRPAEKVAYPSLAEAKKVADPGQRIAGLVAADDDAGRFAWDVTAETLLYAARRVPEIADELPAVDQAMRWGYAWELGPFEIWDALGLRDSLARMEAEGRPVPAWVKTLAASETPTFYRRDGTEVFVWNPREGTHQPSLPRPRTLVLAERKAAGKTLLENDQASLIDLGDGVACVEFRTKANVVDEGVLELLEEAVNGAGVGRDYTALVIGNQGPLFSAGANLSAMTDKVQRQDWAAIEATLRKAQGAMMALKYAPIPVVGAPFAQVLGGGLEVCLHCHRLQASHETAMGLVEVGVGLIPAAGGLKESLLRAMADPAAAQAAPFAAVRRAFQAVFQARVSRSAWDAFDLGYLRPGDGVTMNRDHVLHAAKQAAMALRECGWQPPVSATVTVLGREGLANFRIEIENLIQGDHITEHDRLLGEKVAWVLCGGDVDGGSVASEEHLLGLERQGFLELCREPKTLERIQHMLKTGKPLRN